jgi:hypothetical protein
MAAPRIPGYLVERYAGKQPEGCRAGAALAEAGWHAHKTERWHSWHVHLLPAERRLARLVTDLYRALQPAPAAPVPAAAATRSWRVGRDAA